MKIAKLPKARENALVTKSCLGLVLHLIGWESSASFLDQSQSKVKRNQSNPRLLSKIENCSQGKTYLLQILLRSVTS